MHTPMTLVDVVYERFTQVPDEVAFYDDTEFGWEPYTHRQHWENILAIAHFLSTQNIRRGDRIAIMGRPCYGWEACDKAIMFLGAISVGIDPKAAPADIETILNICEPCGLMLEESSLLAKVPTKYQGSDHFIAYFGGSSLATFPKANKSGPDFPHQAKADDIGTIIFTSGTTGIPQGIPLRHRQLVGMIPIMLKYFSSVLSNFERLLNWLPLHNGTGRMMVSVGYYLGEQYFVKDPLTLFDKIRAINPTVLVVMPRVLEKVYKGLQTNIHKKPFIFRAIVHIGFALGQLPFSWTKKLADIIIMRKLRTSLWGNALRYLCSGSAPVDAKLLKYFDAMGLPTFEVYGETECSVLLTMNRPGEVRYGSVGKPVDGVTLKLAEDGEILVKSEFAMLSYWGIENSSLYTPDGYLKTGDLGRFEDDFLYIIGRKKEIIKTSTGLRIAPVEVERVYQDITGIDYFVVVGNNRKFLTALITLFPDFTKSLAASNINPHTYIADELEKRSDKLAANRRIKKFVVLSNSFSVEGGEITTTLKLRRVAIEIKYASEIDEMYKEEINQ